MKKKIIMLAIACVMMLGSVSVMAAPKKVTAEKQNVAEWVKEATDFSKDTAKERKVRYIGFGLMGFAAVGVFVLVPLAKRHVEKGVGGEEEADEE